MRVLLVHPEDGFGGPWKRERWDWIVDLARAPQSFYQKQSAALGCRISSIYDFAVEIEDARAWRDLFAMGMGLTVDRFGLDWWEIIGLSLQPDLQDLRLAARVARNAGASPVLTTTRPSLMASAVALQLGTRIEVLQSGIDARFRNRVAHYGTALRNLSFAQLRQVVHDKFDPHYRWRQHFARAASPCSQPVVLLPTAYSNVTKTALNYARLLPEQRFLLVVARESAALSTLPDNVEALSLAAFARNHGDSAELRDLEAGWDKLERLLGEHEDFKLAVRLGLVKQGCESLPRWLTVRDAWNRVYEKFTVVGCLSADDSNPYTRIPMILAKRREVPAVACHHGALDFRMAYKVPEFSTYLAQGEMERDYLERTCGVDARQICVGATSARPRTGTLWSPEAPWLVFFSESYESDQWRIEPVYREILPQLCEAARRAGKMVALKLHPFEAAGQRRRLVNSILSKEDQRVVNIIDSPLSDKILRKTWCAVTVESTVACECACAGIPALLCGWLRHAYSGYALQYARFGVGQLLESPDDLLRIPELMRAAMPNGSVATRLSQAIAPEALSDILLHPLAQKMRA